VHDLLSDVRYALRTLRKDFGLTLVIVISLAIGIGANTAIFSVVNALMLKPLPYPEPDRLTALWLRSPGINIPQDWPSPGQYIDVQNENHSFEEMSISQGGSATLIRSDQPERIELLRTSSSLFHLLGATPLHGRLLTAEDDKPGKPAVVLLSHGLWNRLFGADPNVVGQSITLNGVNGGSGENKNQFTVAGVLRPEFMLNDEVMPTVASIRQMEAFVPLPFGADAVNRRGDENYNVMARLRPGVTLAQAQADVSAIAARIREKDKRDKTFTISVVALLDQVIGDVRRSVLVLFGSVALVLLIACANVANLLLSRATGRQKEIAIRAALGAGWIRLVRQLLTESVLLGVLGGAAGLLIARWSLHVVRTVNPGNIPRLESIRIDGGVLAFTLGISVLTGIVFGLAPALRAVNVDLTSALKAGGRSSRAEGGLSASRHGLRGLLVVAELALSLILLVGAGLLIRSYVRLQGVLPGFNTSNVISMRLGVGARRPRNREEAIQAGRALSARITAVPGIKSHGSVSTLPLTSSVGWGSINVEGFVRQPGQELQVDQRAATTDYFRTMEIPLVRGRVFDEHDTMPDAQRVVVVDESFARRFWPNADPIGKHVWRDPKQQMTIVGVVGSVKQYGLDVEGRIVVYYPGTSVGYWVARTSSDPAAAAAAIVAAIHEVDPTIPVYEIRTMDSRLSDSLARRRFSMIMLGTFSAFALILAAVGIYGVMAYLVTQGTHDIGVRIALGAEPGGIVRLVLGQGLKLAIAGVAAGLIGAAALTRVMATLLFGVSATDVVTFSTVPLLLASIALLATYVTARRATRVDPLVALREE